MKKFAITALALAALALPLASQAGSLFTFDPTGTAGASGDIVNLVSFDQAPGNALAINGANAQAGGVSNLLYQANLSKIFDENGGDGFLNGAGGKYFTFVAGFTENITGVANSLEPIPATQTATFALSTAPGGINFFKMYATTSLGDNLAGTGFTTGQLILSGTISATNFTSQFSETLVNGQRSATANFDQLGTNNYVGTTTVIGSGSTSLTTNISFVDYNYFPGFSASSLVLSMLNTSQKLPFAEVNPSAQFSADGVANGGTLSNIGTKNGITGPNFQFQADANSSFQVSNRVPEPGSLALVGFALAGLGFASRRAAKRA